MNLSLNSNASATQARLHLSRNNVNLQKSISRLSSGKRVEKPSDDAGGMAVAMKLESQVMRSSAAMNNMLNAISLLEVQDGVLSSAGQIVDRMSELKGLYHDVMKNETDRESYNKEFRDLQVQLFEMSHIKFNGISLFAQTTPNGSPALFEGGSAEIHTMQVFMNANGGAGAIASIHKALLLSALTVNASTLGPNTFQAGDQSTIFRFASESTDATGSDRVIGLGEVSVGVYSQALQNIATLRAQNGASMSQLEYGYDNLTNEKNNLNAARGRIEDVDMASESTRLSKFNILVQASASMLSQANSLSEISLVLMR